MIDKVAKEIIPGYSSKINDQAFKKYIQNSKIWAAVFSMILALISITGFYIYGERSVEMDNPQALQIGMAIGGMFIAIAIFKIIERRNDTTWDGVITNKFIKKKKHRSKVNGRVDYLEYTVYIQNSTGKYYEISADDDDTIYNYYEIGDKVRHHKGLNSYEKYDKSKDTINFCNACATLNDMSDDFCFRCKCPLLKGAKKWKEHM